MPKDDSTWLNIFYVVSSILVGVVLFKALNTLGIQFGWSEKYISWYPMASTITSVVGGAGFGLMLRTNPERQEYLTSAISEVRKVSWPSWSDTKRMTIVVVVVVAIFAVILMVFDVLWAKTLNLILT